MKRKLDSEALLKTIASKLAKEQGSNQTHSRGKSPKVNNKSPESSKNQVKGNSLEIKPSPGSCQTKAKMPFLSDEAVPKNLNLNLLRKARMSL